MLIALVDPHHLHHHRAHQWVEGEKALKWATCPLTENGFVRILSLSSYPNHVENPAQAIALLTTLRTSLGQHHFWRDAVSITEPGSFHPDLISNSKQITELYLVALAVKHQGCLVTFDRHITLPAIPGATASHIVNP